jgi:DNA-binding XRE family transcriptional regulator
MRITTEFKKSFKTFSLVLEVSCFIQYPSPLLNDVKGGKIMAYQIGKCLLSERLRQVGMTQSELARRHGVSRQQVNKWATNKQFMSLETAKRIASILGLNKAEDLYEWIPTRD